MSLGFKSFQRQYLQKPWGYLARSKDPHPHAFIVFSVGLPGNPASSVKASLVVDLSVGVLPGHQTQAFPLPRQRSNSGSCTVSFLPPKRFTPSWHLRCTLYTGQTSQLPFIPRQPLGRAHVTLPLKRTRFHLARRSRHFAAERYLPRFACLDHTEWGGFCKGAGV